MNVEDSLNMEVSSRYKRVLLIMVSVFVWGILAHGFMIFNKFSYHDDIGVFYGISEMDGGISQGRWMCSVYGYLLSKLYGFDFSLPLFKGLMSFLFIAVSWIVLSDLLELKNKLWLFTVSGVLVVISSITSIFAYMYMALYYTAGLVLSVCGGALLARGKNWKKNLAGIILFVLAIGTYQMFFVTGMCTILIYMAKKVIEQRYKDFRQYLFTGLKYILEIGICLGFYVGITKVLVVITGIPLSNYKNIDRMGIVSVREYITRIGTSYSAFINPNKYVTDIPYPNICSALYHLILIILMIVLIFFLCTLINEGKKTEAIELIIILLIFPLATNFIFVLAGSAGAIQYYGHIFVYVMFVLVLEKLHLNQVVIQKSIYAVAFMVFIFLNIAFCRFSNACYLKANLLQEHAINYFETLNTRIQMTEGYTKDTTVVFIEPRNKIEIDYMDSKMAEIKLIPYSEQSIINNYQWINFARIWCGCFVNVVTNSEEFKDLPEVKDMPIYPDDGSIKMVGDVIVVKFNEAAE